MVNLVKAKAHVSTLPTKDVPVRAVQHNPFPTIEVIPASFEKKIMAHKVVFQFDSAGWYTGPGISRESPRETGVFYGPPNSTEVQPPLDLPSTHWPKWNGSTWTSELIPVEKQSTFVGNLVSTLKAYLDRVGFFGYVIKK